MTRCLHHTSQDESTLRLPRILCLHGGGTNARIFRAQCRALEKALRPWFRLCYAEAPFPYHPGPDVTAVYHTFGPFRAWIDSTNLAPLTMAESLQKSIFQAIMKDNGNGATGPVVGLLGFSQGAKMCASLILEQQLLDQGMNSQLSGPLPRFRFAILLAARGPLVTLSPLSVQADIMQKMGRMCVHDNSVCIHCESGETNLVLTRELIRIPTVHVHGRQDPSLDRHRKFLYENFDPRYARVMEWDGAHRVPLKSKDVGALVQEINSLWVSILLQQPRIAPDA
ncbi:hypothetical protein EYZ11_006390 [Aspergillus tanneri]|uniref:Serine hydrolase domain-containing protein n=1 Tax=Aspergillus tanneri TaxID=1220188 RepID=A0A4S3JLG7_9EURO|nr:uncharacterized protein ATNIH1004_001828 [Aspergillus tanneri]KAA8652919.1 hypothetical protein ATNIH1004_001828 [Aspergillus tanneri]THC94141.1 hypothetical protein EYZ11_006390 [Aspergillus tanneri]